MKKPKKQTNNKIERLKIEDGFKKHK